MSLAAEVVLLGDICATNARFAILTDGVVGSVKWIEVVRYSQIGDAIEYVLGSSLHEMQPSSALLAVAGPVEGERCSFTNCAWTVDGREMRNLFNFKTVRVINDFEATALSLPHLLEQDVRSLGGGRAIPSAPMAVLGPGSGLGVAGLVADGPHRIVIAGEGGHATLPAASLREDAVLDHLRHRFGHVSAERVLSGPGLENIYMQSPSLMRWKCHPVVRLQSHTPRWGNLFDIARG